MKASILDLRRRMAEVLRALDRNEPVTVLYRGHIKAILVPAGLARGRSSPAREHRAFGMWSDRSETEDVPAFVHSLRKGRGDAR